MDLPLLHQSVQETALAACNSKLVKLINKHGTNQEIMHFLASDDDGNTMLHLVIENEKLTEQEKIELAELFLSIGVDPRAENIYQETALHYAVAKRLKGVIDLLIRHKVYINKRKEDGSSIAHYFIEDEFKKIGPMLSSAKVNHENCFSWNGETMAKETVGFVEWLVDKGFDFDGKNVNGHSALDFAISYNLLYIVPALLKKTYDDKYVGGDYKSIFSLFMPRKNPHKYLYERYIPSIVHVLLSRRPPIIIKNYEDIKFINKMVNKFPGHSGIKCATSWFNAIMRSCGYWFDSKIHTYLEFLNDLVAKGADVNYQDESRNLDSPLFLAVRGRNLQAVKFLREKDANFQVNNLLHEFTRGVMKHRVVDKEIFYILLSEDCELSYYRFVPLIWNALVKWVIKLRTANLQYPDEYEMLLDFTELELELEESQLACLEEIEVLKNTFFCNQVSIYDFLHMNSKKKCIYLKNEILLNIINSPVFDETFPEYSILILAKFRKARAWKALRELAKTTWEELTGIYLPNICLEGILAHLNKTDLAIMTKKI